VPTLSHPTMFIQESSLEVMVASTGVNRLVVNASPVGNG
jgi:hypothetical protein